ncbi:MAG: arsenate reductase ArsC [Armatimonadetes bacterium]|nr:arsenate reductase ArsC [Armatimonadota bacterium]
MTVLFVCVHNSGRSQMAEALLRHLAARRGIAVVSTSAGTMGAGSLNPAAVQAMEEIGIPMEGQHPKQLNQTLADSADRIISMGCGVDADACPARFLVTEDWGLDDPAGQPIEAVKAIRDQIRERMEKLLDEIQQKNPERPL